VSIELELEDDGQVRVRLDTEGERAVSDTADPVQLIKDICETAELAWMENTGGNLPEITIMLPSPKELEEDESA
jgi:hypothetical protein